MPNFLKLQFILQSQLISCRQDKDNFCQSYIIFQSLNMLPQDQQRFMLAIFLSMPAGFLLRYIPQGPIRKYYSIILATALQYYVYQNQLFWALGLHIVIYLIIKSKGRNSGFIVTVISIIALAIYHIYRTVTDYGSSGIELSFILMLYVSKYSLFAFAYQDGGFLQDQLKHAYQKQQRILELPSFIDFLGYLQFVPTCILNTPVDYVKYDNYMNKKGHFAQIPLKGSLIKSLKDLKIALICGGLYLIQMIYYPIGAMKQEGFLDNSSLYVYYYCFFSIWLVKCKYYFAWKLSMLPIHFCGVSYSPSADKKDDFLGVQTCNPWEIQTTMHVRDKISNWNITVQQWLRKCVYERLTVSRPKAQLYTFMISAFWHGVYGGYYLSFIIWFMMLYVSGLVFKFAQQKDHPIMKFYAKYEPYTYWVVYAVWNFEFTHNGLYFHLLDAASGFKFLTFFRYASIVLIAVCGVVASTQTKGKKKEKSQQKIVQSKQN